MKRVLVSLHAEKTLSQRFTFLRSHRVSRSVKQSAANRGASPTRSLPDPLGPNSRTLSQPNPTKLNVQLIVRTTVKVTLPR